MNHSMSNDHLSAERFQAFLENELPKGDLVRVEEHLNHCARCSTELDVWRVLFDDLGDLPSLRPPQGFADRVMAAVRVPEPLPLAARIETRVAVPGLVADHIDAAMLQDFIEGALSRRNTARIGRHLEACAACTNEADAWSIVMRRLDRLDTFAPQAGFAERVLAEVAVPVPLPLAARVRSGIADLLGSQRSNHVPAAVLQDFVDGMLPTRAMARVRAHVTDCVTCTSEAEGWRTVMARLETLERFAPQREFADQVMAQVRVPRRAPVVVRAPAWAPILAVARRLVPQTREAWAALSGIAVTPAVTAGLVFYAVFSHPTLTMGSLASFAWWQLTDLGSLALGSITAGLLQSGEVFGAYSLLETLVSAPLMAAAGVLTYSIASVLAMRVLYRNLITNRALDARYAHVSTS